MYKKISPSRIKDSYLCTCIGHEMDISINKNIDTIVTTSVKTSSNPRNRVLYLGLHHFNPPSFNGNLIEKMQAWEEHYFFLQRDKGMHTQA